MRPRPGRKRGVWRWATTLDGFGYTRFWRAEHHDSPGFAGASLEILVAADLERTKRMRGGTVACCSLIGLGCSGGPSAGYPDQLAALQRLLVATDGLGDLKIRS